MFEFSSYLDVSCLLVHCVRRLLFAGEATHPCYFGTVHGAMESGWRAADEVKRLLKSETDEDV